LLEQQFQLKHHGNLSIFEQSSMVAEDRVWFLRRLERELKEKAEAEKKQAGSIPRSGRKP